MICHSKYNLTAHHVYSRQNKGLIPIINSNQRLELIMDWWSLDQAKVDKYTCIKLTSTL